MLIAFIRTAIITLDIDDHHTPVPSVSITSDLYLSRAEIVFTESRRVRVVRNVNGQIQFLFQRFYKRNILPHEIVAVNNVSFLGIDKPGAAYADAFNR